MFTGVISSWRPTMRLGQLPNIAAHFCTTPEIKWPAGPWPTSNSDSETTGNMRPLRIGVNALYLIPGGVGGTEIYLRSLLPALAEIDSKNHYIVFTNQETGPDLVPARKNFTCLPASIQASFRPGRI